MPIVTSWGATDKTVIKIQFVSPWTGNEAMQMVDDSVQMVASAPQPVDILVDFRDAKAQIPTNYLQAILRMEVIGTRQRGIVVVVGAPYFIRALSTIAQGIAPDAFTDVHFVDTMEAAEVVLSEQKQNRA